MLQILKQTSLMLNILGIGLILILVVLVGRVIYEAGQPLPEDGLNQAIRQLNPQQVQERLISEEAIIIDVRTLREWEEGVHVDGAVSIPLNDFDEQILSLVPDKNTEIIVMCYSNNSRSLRAVDWLRQHGYTNVHNLNGGLQAWERNGLPTVPFVVLDDEA